MCRTEGLAAYKNLQDRVTQQLADHAPLLAYRKSRQTHLSYGTSRPFLSHGLMLISSSATPKARRIAVSRCRVVKLEHRAALGKNMPRKEKEARRIGTCGTSVNSLPIERPREVSVRAQLSLQGAALCVELHLGSVTWRQAPALHKENDT